MNPDANIKASIESIEKSSLAVFRTLVDSHGKTQGFQIDDKFLVKFLRSRDLDPQEALKVLVNYIAAVNQFPKIFSWSDGIKKVISCGGFYHYPVKNEDGTKIVGIHLGKWNPKEVTYETWISQNTFFIEVSLMDEDIQKNGFIAVVDARDIGWTHLYNAGLSGMKLSAYLSDHCLPIKILATHVIHENRWTDMAFSMVRPFLGQKLRDQMKFHGNDLPKLFHEVPQSILPKALGGLNKDYPSDYYNQLLETHKEGIVSMWESLRKKRK